MHVTGRRIDPDFQQTLTRVMLDRALPCPHCGYSLSGLAGTRCPECGRNLAEFLRIVDTSPRRVHRQLLRRAFARGVRAAVGVALLAGAVAGALALI